MTVDRLSRASLEINAKYLSPQEIAGIFVPPMSSFERVLRRSNSILIGPRGSGKTTLLKMLTRGALSHWSGPEVDYYRERIAFHGVFVAADRAWGAQLAASAKGGGDEHGEAAFVAHTIIAVVSALRDMTACQVMPAQLAHLNVVMSADSEYKLAEALGSLFDLRGYLPSLTGIELALRAVLLKLPFSEVDEIPFWCRIDRLGHVITNLITIADAYITSETRHWVLMFDELEIAPTRIKEFLLHNLRGFDDRVAFKLALVPFLSDLHLPRDRTAAQAGNDFETIDLTAVNKREMQAFSRDLAARLFATIGVGSSELPRVFGASSFQAGRVRLSSRARSSAPGLDPVRAEFEDLAEKDESFSQYLKEKRVFARFGSEEERAALVRKVLPTVKIRNYYLKWSVRDRRTGTYISELRPRKSYSLYVGYPSFLELADGNPRTLLSLVTPVIEEYAIRREHDARAVISTDMQNRAIARVLHTFVALIRTLPPSWSMAENPSGLLALVDDIGEALKQRLLRGRFEVEYVGSFTIPSRAPDWLIAAFGDALNAGIFVHVPDEDSVTDGTLTGLRGKTFRLSYLLAPRYRLALTRGQPLSLSKLLSDQPNPEFFRQGKLALENDNEDHG